MTQTATTSSSSHSENADLPVGERIREARIAAGKTNKQLAEKLDLDVRTVAGWQAKKPRSRPSYERLLVIAGFLGKPVSFFLEASV